MPAVPTHGGTAAVVWSSEQQRHPSFNYIPAHGPSAGAALGIGTAPRTPSAPAAPGSPSKRQGRQPPPESPAPTQHASDDAVDRLRPIGQRNVMNARAAEAVAAYPAGAEIPQLPTLGSRRRDRPVVILAAVIAVFADRHTLLRRRGDQSRFVQCVGDSRREVQTLVSRTSAAKPSAPLRKSTGFVATITRTFPEGPII
jgi:hypothetical protein